VADSAQALPRNTGEFSREVEDRPACVVRSESAPRHLGARVEPGRVGAERNQGPRFRAGIRIVEETLPKCGQRTGEAGRDRIGSAHFDDLLDPNVGEEGRQVAIEIRQGGLDSAEAALVSVLDEHGAEKGVSEGALVSMDTSGAVRAIIGGRNYVKSQFNRAIKARRQPGSSFKTFVYLAAMEAGLTPDTVRNDAPVAIRGVQIQVSYADNDGSPRQLTRSVGNRIEPGQIAKADTGLGPYAGTNCPVTVIAAQIAD